MSTSESELGGFGPGLDRQAGSSPIADFRAASPFDPSTLARMANEFFSAAPEGVSSPSQFVPADAPVDPTSFSPISASTPSSVPAARPEVSLPSDPHFPGIPASAGPASVTPVTAPVQATPPAIPGALGSSVPSQPSASFGAFSFLQDTRPIVADREVVPTPAYPQARPITEFDRPESAAFGDPFSLEEKSVLPRGFDVAQPPSPSAPGSFGFADSSAFPAFSFLEEARPLFSYPPSIPGPVPALPEKELPTQKVPAAPQTPNLYNAGADLYSIPKSPFSFLSEVRAIAPTEAVSTHEPVGNEPDVPRDLNLSSYSFDAEALKRDFPILRERVNGRPLVWLDNAATTQKPQSVIDRLKYFYEHENSNVHRAAHELAARATDAYESAREKVRRFLNASSSREIIFVRGATEGINLIAQSWGWQNIQKDDEIVITWLEHHANIVPWQMLCSEKGARLRVAPVDSTGQILLDEYEKLLGSRTRLVSFTHVSNALGVVTPAREIIDAAHRYGAKVLLDGAQSVSHMRVDVQSLDCDFFVFSGHKVFAPTGIGVVYGKPDVLEYMPPWQGGGNMIQDVTFEKTIYQAAPQRFEAGTGNIADAVGLGAAIDYLDRAGMENITRHEHGLLVYATEALQQMPGLRMIGTSKEKAGVLSFVMEGFRTEEVGNYLNRNGIAVRSGHHCAQPILRRFGLESTVRASLALYNTFEDIDALVRALWNLRLGQTSIV
ncbi:family 2A encapsulin nanocompartment cargo protein cysteine desulfurase [Acidicapsa ligni]|uniref:family 2A encapsulin nanocompartment cargo protein cysteine desulfurase n=1 Tax=Acidicapsa ligni TaxID=542300 RepID=UPI0021E07E0E|nr:family 2A encapsulin nanocompartment cargo protein cysteine desulfurase [Acidicapsa ligni]